MTEEAYDKVAGGVGGMGGEVGVHTDVNTEINTEGGWQLLGATRYEDVSAFTDRSLRVHAVTEVLLRCELFLALWYRARLRNELQDLLRQKEIKKRTPFS